MPQKKNSFGTRLHQSFVFVFLGFSFFVIFSSLLFSRFWLVSYSDKVRTKFLERSYDSFQFFLESKRKALETVAEIYFKDRHMADTPKVSSDLIVSLKQRFDLDGIAVLNDLGKIELSDSVFLKGSFNQRLPEYFSSSEKISGFWHDGGARLWLLFSSPVPSADSPKERAGTLVLGFLMNDKLQKDIGQRLGIKAEFFHHVSFAANGPGLSGAAAGTLLSSWKELLYMQKPFLVQKDSQDEMRRSYFLDVLIRDLKGDPVGILRITDNDSDNLLPQRNILFLFMLVIIFFIVSFIFIAGILTRFTVTPLVKINTAVNEIVNSRNFSGRIALEHEDEVCGLGLQFNNLLDILERLDRNFKSANEKIPVLYTDLMEQKRFISEILKLAPSIVLMLLPDGRVKYVNDAIETLTGYNAQESLGRVWFDQFVPFSCRSQIKAAFDEILRGDIDKHRQKESPVLTKDGQERLVLWSNSILRSDDGEVSAVISVGQDISELKNMQSELVKKVIDLERFYKVSMDREKAILQLKAQIRELKSQCGILQDKEKKAP